MVVPLYVYNHIKHFGDIDEYQSEFPDTIDKYKSAKGYVVVPLNGHSP